MDFNNPLNPSKLVVLLATVVPLTVILVSLAQFMGNVYLFAVPVGVLAFQKVVVAYGRINNVWAFANTCFMGAGVGFAFFVGCATCIWFFSRYIFRNGSIPTTGTAGNIEVACLVGMFVAILETGIFVLKKPSKE